MSGASGCAKAKAANAPQGPPLNVPVPPPRVIAPVEEPVAENPPEPEPAPPQPRPPAARPAQPPPRNRPATTTAEPEPKPEPPAAQTPPPAPEPPAAASRPAPTQADVATERRVRGVIQEALNKLNNSIDYQKLSADGRAQYQQAKRFTDQADQELKKGNYAFASTVADKAAAIATELLGR